MGGEHKSPQGDNIVLGIFFGPAMSWLCVKSPMPYCKAYTQEVGDGHLTVFVGQEPSGKNGDFKWHLSISHRSSKLLTPEGHPLPGRIPTWDEIKTARYKFVPDQVYMAMILPPMSEYVNVHPTTMHLHEIDAD